MREKKAEPKYRTLAISSGVSLTMLITGIWLAGDLGIHRITAQLLWPLIRLVCSRLQEAPSPPGGIAMNFAAHRLVLAS